MRKAAQFLLLPVAAALLIGCNDDLETPAPDAGDLGQDTGFVDVGMDQSVGDADLDLDATPDASDLDANMDLGLDLADASDSPPDASDAGMDADADADMPPSDGLIYPLAIETQCTFGTDDDCNPVIDNVVARLDTLSGVENYISAPYGNTGCIDGINNHWQGITRAHYQDYRYHVWLSRSRTEVGDANEIFNYFDMAVTYTSATCGERAVLAYENCTEPDYYNSLYPSWQLNHGGAGQGIGKYLLFPANQKSDPANSTQAMILDLSQKWATDNKAPLVVADFNMTTHRPNGTNWACDQWIGNAGIAKLSSGHYMIVDTCSNGTDFKGFQVYISDTPDITADYVHRWTIEHPQTDWDVQQISVIGQDDGQIHLILARKSYLEAFRLVISSPQSATVAYDSTLSNNEYASSFTPGTSDFRSGGGVAVWRHIATQEPRMLVMSTQMGEWYPNVCSRFAQWMDTYQP